MKYRVYLTAGGVEEHVDPNEANIMDGGVLRIVSNDNSLVTLYAGHFWAKVIMNGAE